MNILHKVVSKIFWTFQGTFCSAKATRSSRRTELRLVSLFPVLDLCISSSNSSTPPFRTLTFTFPPRRGRTTLASTHMSIIRRLANIHISMPKPALWTTRTSSTTSRTWRMARLFCSRQSPRTPAALTQAGNNGKVFWRWCSKKSISRSLTTPIRASPPVRSRTTVSPLNYLLRQASSVW